MLNNNNIKLFTITSHFLRRYSVFITVALQVVFLLIILTTRIRLIRSYTTNIHGVELNTIYGIQQILSGHHLYSDPEAFPFSIIQYTPIYYYICAFLASLISVDHSDVHQLLVIGRIVNLLFNIGTSGLIFYILKKVLKLKWLWASSASILVFALQFYWNYAVRPDSMFNFFGLLCFLFFIVSQNSKTSRASQDYLIAACFLAVMSVFIKQSGIQFSLIILSYLLLSRQYKHFFIFLICLSAFSITSLFISNLILGKFFFKNVILGVDNGIRLLWFYYWILNTKYFYLLVLLLLFNASFFIQSLKDSNSNLNLLSYLSICTFAFALIIATKWGSTIHYFIDFLCISIISIFYYISYALKLENIPTLRNLKIWSLVGGSVLLFLLTIDYYYIYIKYRTSEASYQLSYTIQQKIGSILKNELKPDEYILTDYAMVTGHFLINHYLFPQRDIVECCSYKRNTYNYSRLYDIIKKGQIKFIITTSPDKPTRYLGALLGTYKLYKQIDNYSIYTLNRK